MSPVAVLLALVPSQTAAPSRLAVLDFATPGIEAQAATALSQNLVNVVAAEAQALGWAVISSADINALLSLEKQKDLVGCADNTSCLSEIGGALGVDLMLAGSVGLMGETYTLTLTLIDTRTAEVKERFQAQAGSAGVLDNTARRGVQVLFGKKADTGGTGMLVVRTEPEGAALLLDGKPAGVSPVTLDAVSAGDHLVTASLAEMRGSADVRVTAGGVERVTVTLSAGVPVKVKIISNPPDAIAYLDGREVGVTPLSIADARSGEHRLRLEAEGYLPYDEPVTFSGEAFEQGGGEPLKIEATLEKHYTLIAVPVGLSLGLGMDGRRADLGVGAVLELFIEPWPWLELGLGYNSPAAVFLSIRLLPLHGGLELGPIVRVATFPLEPSRDEWSGAIAFGAGAGAFVETGFGEAGLRFEALWSLSADGWSTGHFTVPLALSLVWRI